MREQRRVQQHVQHRQHTHREALQRFRCRQVCLVQQEHGNRLAPDREQQSTKTIENELRVDLPKTSSFSTTLIIDRSSVRRQYGFPTPMEVIHGAYESPKCLLQLSVSKDMDTYLRIRIYEFLRILVSSSVAVSE
jgi:hypothetical protein